MPRVTAVLLPGLDGTGDLFAPFVDAAPPDVDCLVVRYPTNELLGYEELEKYVAAQLPPGGEFVLIAESFSGPVAVRIADQFDGRVAHVILCNSFVTPPRSRLLRVFARSIVFRVHVPERILAHLMLAPLATPALTSALASTLRKVDPPVLAHRMRELLTVNELARRRRLTAPITYLRGSLDRLVPTAAVVQIKRAVSTVRVRHIEGPHALLQTAPRAAWESTKSVLHGTAG